MTKEEAIKVLNQVRQWTDYPKEAFTMAIDALSKPSLPLNLDEAVHSYSESDEPLYSPGHRFHWDSDSLFGKQIETTFKAGAEWLAGQGVSMVITDETKWEDVDKFVHRNCDGSSIIQIRKKD